MENTTEGYSRWCVLSRSVVSDSLRPYGLYPPRLLCPWDSPGKNTGVGCHPLLQGIFQTQESSRGLLHCRQILNCPRHQERPSRERERDSFTHFLIRGHVLILKRTIVKCRDRTACQDCKADYIDCFF